MPRILHGTIRGRSIEFSEDLGLSEGQEVEVQLRIAATHKLQTGEGLLRTEGALVDDLEWDAIMEEIYQARKTDRGTSCADLGEP